MRELQISNRTAGTGHSCSRIRHTQYTEHDVNEWRSSYAQTMYNKWGVSSCVVMGVIWRYNGQAEQPVVTMLKRWQDIYARHFVFMHTIMHTLLTESLLGLTADVRVVTNPTTDCHFFSTMSISNPLPHSVQNVGGWQNQTKQQALRKRGRLSWLADNESQWKRENGWMCSLLT